jgi:hypothetical protein
MPHDYGQIILERIAQPGWVTTRGVLRDPTGQADPEDYLALEELMKEMAANGVVALWTLTLDEDGSSVMAAVRPGIELDKELQLRNAAAKAQRLSIES